MFASTLFADEDDVRDFHMQIQHLLRAGRADEAAAIIDATLGQFGQSGHALADFCLVAPIETTHIAGWDGLAARIGALDKPGAPITALGIDISSPGHHGLEPDADGNLEPHLEISYYSDGAFGFASADRAALLAGYGPDGPRWQRGMVEIDNQLSVSGLGHLHGMIYPLVESVAATADPDPLDADAMRLGAAFIAVRLHQAVALAIRLHGLPRPLAVIVGSNESYPFYDAPVLSAVEAEEFVDLPIDTEAAEALVSDERWSQPVPDDVASDATGAVHPEPSQAIVPDHDALTLDGLVIQISGASLRQRLGQQRAAELSSRQSSKAAGGLLRRLFAR